MWCVRGLAACAGFEGVERDQASLPGPALAVRGGRSSGLCRHSSRERTGKGRNLQETRARRASAAVGATFARERVPGEGGPRWASQGEGETVGGNPPPSASLGMGVDRWMTGNGPLLVGCTEALVKSLEEAAGHALAGPFRMN